MGFTIDDLPHEEFTVVDESPGVYRVGATRTGGICGERTGAGPEAMLKDLKAWAQTTDRALDQRRNTSHGTPSRLPG